MGLRQVKQQQYALVFCTHYDNEENACLRLWTVERDAREGEKVVRLQRRFEQAALKKHALEVVMSGHTLMDLRSSIFVSGTRKEPVYLGFPKCAFLTMRR